MAELSDDEIKKLPPPVRDGYLKARRKSTGQVSPEAESLSDFLNARREQRGKEFLDDVLNKVKEARKRKPGCPLCASYIPHEECK